MRSLFIFLFLILGAATVHAQGAAPGGKELSAVCEEAIGKASSLNYLGLINAVGSCEQAGRLDDAVFFLLASQVRLSVDSELLFPLDEEAKARRASFTNYLFYRAGGAGPDVIYRDPARTERLFARLRNWEPEITPDYDPGWTYKQAAMPVADDLSETAARHIHNRIEQLRHYAALVGNDEYYETRTQLNELGRKHNNTFVVDTPVYAQQQALQETLRRVEAKLNLPPPNIRAQTKIRVDPDADFRPLFSGGNGPEQARSFVLSEAGAARATFLGAALTSDQIDAIEAEVDFEAEVLVVLAVGRRSTATGKLIVTDLTLDGLEPEPSMRVALRVGVLEEGCAVAPRDSYPFIVMAKQRPANPRFTGRRGQSLGNFPDGCGPPMTGEANN